MPDSQSVSLPIPGFFPNPPDLSYDSNDLELLQVNLVADPEQVPDSPEALQIDSDNNCACE
jgi:hypothetical protein